VAQIRVQNYSMVYNRTISSRLVNEGFLAVDVLRREK
jgi:hypothetical protein